MDLPLERLWSLGIQGQATGCIVVADGLKRLGQELIAFLENHRRRQRKPTRFAALDSSLDRPSTELVRNETFGWRERGVTGQLDRLGRQGPVGASEHI